MKKLGFIVMSLMATSLLAGCSGSPTEYIVTFESNGGTHVDTQKVKDKGTATEPNPAPTKTDYTFGGWYENSDLSGDPFNFDIAINKDYTFYAKWTGGPQPVIPTYSIDFQGENCTSTLTPATQYHTGDPVSFNINISDTSKYKLPEKINVSGVSTFDYTNQTGAVSFIVESKDIGVIAKADTIDPAVQHTVTFILNGATSPAIDPVTVNENNPYPSDKIPTPPTKPGHTFEGWSDKENTKSIIDLTKGPTINSDLILYAWWGNAQSIDITFDANGGYFDTTTTTTKVVPTTYGQVPVAPTPTKVVAGQTSTFKGWDKTLTPAKPESEGGTTTYTAQWDDVTNKCHVTFNGNGGTITAGGNPLDVDYGSTIASTYRPTVTRSGYDSTNVEWYDAATGGNLFTFGTTEVKSDITLYAHWGSIKTYTVIFNADGGTYPASEGGKGTVTRKNVAYNTLPNIPAAPTKVDSTGVKTYTFIGYDKNVMPVTGDATTITYDAQWSEVINMCHVTFNGNGGTITSGGNPLDITYGNTIPVAQRPAVSRDGYEATTSWYDAPTGGNLFTFGTTTVTTNMTLYARWGDIKTYTVVFDADGGKYGTESTITRNNVPYNTIPEIPDAPTRVDSTGAKTYTFTGYDKNVEPVTGDNTNPITYTAQWKETTNVYTLTVSSTNEGKFPDSTTTKSITLAAGSNILNSIAYLSDPIFKDTDTIQVFDKYVYENGSEISSSDVVDKDGIKIKATYRNKTLEECSWNEISTISSKGKDFAASYFGPITSTSPLTKTVMVNNQPHTVRIIGYGQDVDKNGQEIGITFEFANLISDAYGYSLATYWKNTNTTDGSNSDYRDSSIRKALTNEGNGDLNWFEKDSKSFSTNLANKSVLDMLPSDLSSVLKTVKKTVNVKSDTTWTPTDFNDKLFLLSPEELGYTSASVEEATPYTFYKEHSEVTDAIRIKAQVKGEKGARTVALSGSDLAGAYTGTKYSYAGYHNGQGAFLWLRSPGAGSTDEAWYVRPGGSVYGDFRVYGYAFGVAPAFCI